MRRQPGAASTPDAVRAAADSTDIRPAAPGAGHCGDAASNGADALRRLLADPSPDVRTAAAGAVWRVTKSAAPALPVLAEILRGPASNEALDRWTEAAVYLREMGRAAAPDVPAIASAIDRADDCGVQGPLFDALAAIGPASVAAMPQIRKALRDEYSCRHGSHASSVLPAMTFPVLVALGPAAKEAAPDLRKWADDRDAKVSTPARAAMQAITGKD